MEKYSKRQRKPKTQTIYIICDSFYYELKSLILALANKLQISCSTLNILIRSTVF